jgi:hypothetical protein
MASLLFDRKWQTFYVRFRYGGRSFKRSLETANQKLARGQVARVEEMLLLLRRGAPSEITKAFISRERMVR